MDTKGEERGLRGARGPLVREQRQCSHQGGGREGSEAAVFQQ